MHSLSPQCAAACKAVLFSSSWILNIIAVAVLTSWHKQCLKSVWNYLYDTCTLYLKMEETELVLFRMQLILHPQRTKKKRGTQHGVQGITKPRTEDYTVGVTLWWSKLYFLQVAPYESNNFKQKIKSLPGWTERTGKLHSAYKLPQKFWLLSISPSKILDKRTRTSDKYHPTIYI